MGRRSTAVAALICALAAAAAPPAIAQDDGGDAPAKPKKPPRAAADPALPFHERVGKAIDLGVAYLKTRAGPHGSFGPIQNLTNYTGGSEVYPFPAGPTALALYALLKSGVPPEDPVVVRGFQWLREKQEVPGSSYEISCLILALEARANPPGNTEPKPDAARAPRGAGSVKLAKPDAEWMETLLEQLLRRREKRPAWRYNIAVPGTGSPLHSSEEYGGDLDMSSTQLAILALAAAERCGYRQPDSLYLELAAWVLEQQDREGPAVARDTGTPGGSTVADRARGWGYLPRKRRAAGDPSTGSMTACGMANLTLLGDILEGRRSVAWKERLADKAETAWWDGNAWFVKEFQVSRNPFGSSHYYYLYCVERAADLRGVALLGGHDWYRRGATYLVENQATNGSWTSRSDYQPRDTLCTAFALLFLRRATRAAVTGE
jgi:hypothetical protein